MGGGNQHFWKFPLGKLTDGLFLDGPISLSGMGLGKDVSMGVGMGM